MALAYLRYEDSDGQQCRFTMDLGRNRYYAYAIGDGETMVQHGVRLLQNRHYASRVLGPLPDDSDGRGELQVPCQQFDRENQAIQLISFRRADRVGPAVSEIVTVPSDGAGDGAGDRLLPEISLVRSMEVDAQMMPNPYAAAPVRPMAAYAQIMERRPLSTAQFLDGLVSLLPTLLQNAGPLLTSLFGGGGGGAAAGSSVPDALLRFVQQLLQATAAPPAAPPPLTPPRPTTASVQAMSAPVFMPTTMSGQRTYSEPMFAFAALAPLAPMLLQALPALAPVLQQVLNPQTIQAVLQTADPNRLVGTVANAVQGLAQLGMQGQQAQMDFVRAIHPNLDDPALNQLLATLSTNLQEDGRSHHYRRVQSVRLHFGSLPPVQLAGRQVVACRYGADLEFPLLVETKRPIPPGIARLVIKHATTLEVMARARVETPPCNDGALPVVPRLAAQDLTKLVPGEDYLVNAHLVWKNKSGEKIGVMTTQAITVVGEFTFDSVEQAGTPVALNDVDRYRDFWHKVWQDSFTRDLSHVEFEVKYYYVLEHDRTENGQVETTINETEHGVRRSTSRLKSGLLLSPNRLNELLPRISSYKPLDEARLAALLAPSYVKRLHLAARTHVKFAGRPGRSAALWVFPEMKVEAITLLRAAEVRTTGQVMRLEPETIHFPAPALVHFVGVGSQ